MYEYDSDGRLVGSRPEVEWDEVERGWMLALQKYRADEICGLCGGQKSECSAPGAENAFKVPPPTRCHVTTALRRAQEDWHKKPHEHGDAIRWAVERV